MMDRSVYRVHDWASEIAEQHARIRELIARASEVLKLPKSDTVLSRKTQKPFPSGRTRKFSPIALIYLKPSWAHPGPFLTGANELCGVGCYADVSQTAIGLAAILSMVVH